jgi:hypothetical protein
MEDIELTRAQHHMLRAVANGGEIDIDGHSVTRLQALGLISIDPRATQVVSVTELGARWIAEHPRRSQ